MIYKSPETRKKLINDKAFYDGLKHIDELNSYMIKEINEYSKKITMYNDYIEENRISKNNIINKYFNNEQ